MRGNRTVPGVVLRLLLVGFALSLGSSAAFAWTPPIGIPAPPWPADLDIPRPPLPSPWTSEQAGWYFVSPAGCSDSGRAYGHPAAPRCTLPASPPAGSKIVLNGTIEDTGMFSFSGTAANPVWIMGYDVASPPTITGNWGIEGSYKILDGLVFRSTSQDENLYLGGSNNMVRNLSFTNAYSASNGCVVAGGGTNNVMYHCTISQSGNWKYNGSEDIDRHGVKVIEGADRVWYVDSTFYHIQGDAIQVGGVTEPASAINKVYIGRNRAYENLQSCFWTKNATDVIISENICSDIDFSPGGDGQGLGGQYDPKYVWFLYNTVYNTRAGIKVSGPNDGDGGPWHMIGNRVYAVQGDNSCSIYESGALNFRNDGAVTMLFNTVHDVDLFVAIAAGTGATARNNIFSAKRATSGCAALTVTIPFVHDYNLYSAAGYVPGNESHKIVGNPLVADAAAGNFTLQSGSPAVNAANPTEEPAFAAFRARYGFDIKSDSAGTARPQGSRWDIGAYEYPAGGSPAPRIPAPPSNLRIE